MTREELKDTLLQNYQDGVYGDLADAAEPVRLMLEGIDAAPDDAAAQALVREGTAQLLQTQSVAGLQSALPDLGGGQNIAGHQLPALQTGTQILPPITNGADLTGAGLARLRADQANQRATDLFRQDDDESFLGNLLDIPAGIGHSLSGLAQGTAASLMDLGRTPEETQQDQQILEELSVGAATAVPDAPDAVELATENAGLPDLGIPSFDALGTLDGVSQAYEGLAQAYDGQAANMTPPPDLDSYDYDLANFLSIINRGSLTPEWRDLQQYELQSNFEARQSQLELGAAQARAEGQTTRAQSLLEAAQEGRSVEAAIRTDRDAYVDGPAGDYFYGQNSGDNEASATGLMEYVRTSPGGEASWATLAAANLGLSEVGDFNTLRTAVAGLRTELAPVARQFGMDIDDIVTDDEKLIEFVNTAVSKGADGNFAAQATEIVPGLAEALRIDDANAFRDFLQPDIAQRLESVQSFNTGSDQNRPTTELFISADGNEVYEGLTQDALSASERLVSLQGRPITVTSAVRSQARQDELYAADLRRNGGRPSGRVARSSEHTRGNALDVNITGMTVAQRRQFLQNAYEAGFRGFGFYGQNGHVHIDTGNNRTWGSQPDWAAGFNIRNGSF